MDKNNKNPEVRFKGFVEDWKIQKLKDVSTYSNGGSFENYVKEFGRYELITLKSINMSGKLVHSGRFIDIETPTLDKGTLVMILSEQAPGLLGMTAQIPTSNSYVLNQRVAEIRPNQNIDSYFLSMAINKNQPYFSNRGAGSKVQNISKPNVENYEFSCPLITEQKQIGAFFQNLDGLITQHQIKHDKLVILKKAMLEKMFPKNGAVVPEIRFKGFTDDWEVKEIDKIANRYDNLRIPIAANKRIKGKTPYYGANGIQDYVEGHTHEGEFILIAEDGANDLKNYPVQYVKGKIWVNNHAHVLQTKKNIADNNFLKRTISNTNIEPFLVGGGRAKLNAEIMMKIEVKIPTSIKEQQKIGFYFKNLDTQINLHQTQLDKLKNIKKACLSKMFVAQE